CSSVLGGLCGRRLVRGPSLLIVRPLARSEGGKSQGADDQQERAANEPATEKPNWRETWDDDWWDDDPSGRAANLTLAGRADALGPPPEPKPSPVDPLSLPLDLEKQAAELDLTDELTRSRRRTLRRTVAYDELVAFELTKML